MSKTDKDSPIQSNNENQKQEKEQKRKNISDKLNKKLEKLKKDDPNIYPVF